MSLLLRIVVALVLGLGLAACGTDPDEVALKDSCSALTTADWTSLDASLDEISSEYAEVVDMDNFHAVVDGSRAEEFAFDDKGNVSTLELMGRDGAVRHVRSGFEGAWATCAEKFEDTPPANGTEFKDVWDELGSGLFYLFGLD